MGDGDYLGRLKQCSLPWLSTGVARGASETQEAQVAPPPQFNIWGMPARCMLEADVFATENEVLLVAFSNALPLI